MSGAPHQELYLGRRPFHFLLTTADGGVIMAGFQRHFLSKHV